MTNTDITAPEDVSADRTGPSARQGLHARAFRLLAPLIALSDWVEARVQRWMMAPLSNTYARLDALSYKLEGTWIRWIVCVSLFPALMIATLVIGFWLVEDGYTHSVTIVTMFVHIAFGLVFAPLERLFPFSRKWLDTRSEASVDLMILFGSNVWKPLIMQPLGLVLMVLVLQHLSPQIGQDIWPSHWNPVVQVFLLLTIRDFFNYWYHRAMHEHPFLWRWHAVHHSAERLYWFNGRREHPLEQTVALVLFAVPLAFVQAPVDVAFVTWMLVITISRFQHTNVDVKLGPLNYIFSAPGNHRYHHSKKIEEGNSNYGGDVMLWDHLFGTFHMPRGQTPSDDIGIGDMPNFPKSYAGLMLAPFLWDEEAYRKTQAPSSSSEAKSDSSAWIAGR